jgi:malonyl-CoA O-methyltransferase
MSSNVKSAYDEWSQSYDQIENKTRDLDLYAAQQTLQSIDFKNVLELGCGTGKNTNWLQHRAEVKAVDFSEGMLVNAREKIFSPRVSFQKADISQQWQFGDTTFNLIMCNLVLEHIKDLQFIFSQARQYLAGQGYFFICELHPFKQYTGSRARYQNDCQTIEPECFTHNVSDYFNAGKENGFVCTQLSEWFDDDQKEEGFPRLISFLFRKD